MGHVDQMADLARPTWRSTGARLADPEGVHQDQLTEMARAVEGRVSARADWPRSVRRPLAGHKLRHWSRRRLLYVLSVDVCERLTPEVPPDDESL